MLKNSTFNDASFSGEGEPASRKELKEAAGIEYVPKNPEKAIAYYEGKRRKTINDPGLSNEEKYELIAYYDRKRLALTVEDGKSYGKYFDRYHNDMQGEFIGGANSSLRKMLAKDHMHFGPDVSFIAPKSNPISGLSFRSDISGVEYYNDKRSRMRVDMDITESDRPNIKHRASVYIDEEMSEVRTAVIPEGLQIQHPPANVSKLFEIPRVELEAVLSVANLSRPIEYDPRAFSGKRLAPAENPENAADPTRIEEETPSILPYRRRTIESSGELREAINDLVSGWSEEERRILEKEGGGSIIMRVYARKDNYNLMGSAAADNLSLMERLAERALAEGQALITFEHAWRPPEIDEAGPGAPHRPHTRRLRGGIILTVGNTVPQKERKEILQIWRKRKRGLSETEQERLKSFLNDYGLSDDVEIDLTIADGIHYKDGKFVSAGEAGGRHEYSV
ncbi:MAG: hypothetical protein V1867_02655 [Candidatus Falkowbacteria bacterium]